MAEVDEIRRVKKKHETSIMAKENVVGMGVGYKETKGAKTDRMALVVMVTKKVSAEQLKAGDVIPAEIEGGHFVSGARRADELSMANHDRIWEISAPFLHW